jgi:MoxR-like ATPase
MEIICIERQGERIVSADPGIRPILVITSNSERRLPEPFLRRCVYHNIVLNEREFSRIIERRLSRYTEYIAVEPDLRQAAQTCFFFLRNNDALQKKPSIDEFWHWLVITAGAGKEVHELITRVAKKSERMSQLPFLSALVKLGEDEARLG